VGLVPRHVGSVDGKRTQREDTGSNPQRSVKCRGGGGFEGLEGKSGGVVLWVLGKKAFCLNEKRRW